MSSKVKSACPAAAEVTSADTGIAVASSADGAWHPPQLTGHRPSLIIAVQNESYTTFSSQYGSVRVGSSHDSHPPQLTWHRSTFIVSVQKKSFLEIPSMSAPVVPSTQNCSVRVGSAHDSGVGGQ
eukprot:scaffold55078_cov73-Phaeocystis_antarctica.AAC.5